MKFLKKWNNSNGAITAFFIIVTSAVIWTFFLIIFIYGNKIGEELGVNFLEVASEDLLLNPDEYILENYGLACYDKNFACERLEESISLNCEINNKNSKFYTINLNELNQSSIKYEMTENIRNHDILKYQILKFEGYQSVMEFTNWFLEKIEVTKNMEETIKRFSEGTKLGEKVKNLYEYKIRLTDMSKRISTDHLKEIEKIKYLASEDLPKFYSKLNKMKAENKSGLNAASEIKNQLLEISNFDGENSEIENMKRLTEDSISLEEIDSYRDMFSNNISLIDKLKGKINKAKAKDIEFDVTEYFEDYKVRDEENSVEKNSGWEIIDKIIDLLGQLGYDINSFYSSNYYGEYDSKVSLDEKILIDEYILSVFQKNVENEVRDFKFAQRDNRDSYIEDGEVEYILTGIENKKMSKIEIASEIFLIREGLNIISLIADKEKMAIVNNIGEICGAIFPPALPAAICLSVTGWSALESVYDVKEIYEGRGIPFIKTNDEWVTMIDLNNKKIYEKKVTTIKKDEEFEKIYYGDYLRLLLFFLDNDDKFYRIGNVIEKNYCKVNGSDINLDQYAVEHSINVNYEVNTIFSSKLTYKTMNLSDGY